MAGILERFKDIMSANINALLDKAEDPEKMMDQYLRDMQEELGEVKAQTAAIMAEKTRAERALSESREEVDKLENYAKKALQAGNENDARAFLEQKVKEQKVLADREQAAQKAGENARKMREMYDKLSKDIGDLSERRAELKAKVQMAQAQQKINQMAGSTAASMGDSMGGFARMEEKATRMLDEAEAMAELNSQPANAVEELMAKYDDSEVKNDASVSADLERLKREIGL
jgi:phage shock protein A